MTSERVRAYGFVLATLRDIGPAKLTASEQQRIRDAADALVFCESLAADEAAQAAVRDVGALGRRLVESDRWSARRTERLLDAVHACGPADSFSLPAAA